MQFSAKILVRKLSPGQAREFGFYAVKQGSTNLLVELFRAYRSGNGLSEQAVAEKVGINPKSLSSYRAQLANLVLEFLAYQKFKASAGSHSYFKYKVLMELGFEEKAKKELEKAIQKKSNELEVEELFPVLMNLDAENQQDVQEMGTFQDFFQLMQLRELKAKLAIGIREVFMPQPHISAMESIAAEYPILNHPGQITSPRVKAEYHDVKRRIFIYQRDLGKAEVHIVACLKVIDQNPRLKEEMAATAIEMVERLALLDNSKANHDRAAERILTIESYGKSNPNLDWRKKMAFFSIHLAISIETGTLRLGPGIIDDFLLFLRRNKGQIRFNRYLVRLYSLALLSGMIGKWGKAQAIVDRYQIEPKSSKNRPHNLYVHILSWIILFEQGKLLQLEEAVLKSSREIPLDKRSSRFYSEAKELFTQILETQSDQLTLLFLESRRRFLDLQNHPDESDHLSYLNLILWLDSKIDSRPWIEVTNSDYLVLGKSNQNLQNGTF